MEHIAHEADSFVRALDTIYYKHFSHFIWFDSLNYGYN
jgi:hypothetical protein